MNLDQLLQQPKALPTIPKVVHELIQSFNNEDVAVADIVRSISADAVLSARLLRLANSAYYHVSRTVATVEDAVLMLGFVQVRTLVIATGLTSGFKSMPGVDLKQFWRYSLHTAVAAKHLARPLQLNAELAFTAGLMHAIGELVMHAAMPEPMLQLDKMVGVLDPRRIVVEQQSFGYSYVQAGAKLAEAWKFPADFVGAIGGCGQPLAQAEFSAVGALIHIAAWRARAEENHLNAEELDATWPVDVASKIGLAAQAVLQDMPSWEELSAGLDALIS